MNASDMQGKMIELADDLAYARQTIEGLSRVYLVRCVIGVCRPRNRRLLVQAVNPVRAAEIAVESSTKTYGRPHTAYVCEYKLTGREGVVKAANMDGDIRYDVTDEGNVNYSEKSFA